MNAEHKNSLKSSRKQRLNCDRCQRRLQPWEKNQKNCDHCDSLLWAENLLKNNFIVLDTETTGLHNADIVEISIIDNQDKTLLDIRLNPAKPIEYGAKAIHGISHGDVKDCPTFPDIYESLQGIINGKVLTIYNSAYDWTIIQRLCKQYGLPPLEPSKIYCTMKQYASFYGERSNYNGSYRWQSLQGGDHSALGDCKATLSLIQLMSIDKYPIG